MALDPDHGDVIGNLLFALAGAFKQYGTDILSLLRNELDWNQLTVRLADWESVLSLTQSPTALYGSLAARRAQVTARRREFGPSTPGNIQNAISAVMGYTPTILEVSRPVLSNENAYTAGTTAIAAALSSASLPIKVLDEPTVSSCYFDLELTATTIENVTVVLQDTTGSTVKSWTAGTWTRDTGAVTAQAYRFYAPEAAGLTCYGNWTLGIVNFDATHTATIAGTLLYIEATGRDAHGFDGLGAEIFDWGVFYDSTKVSSLSTVPFTAGLIARWNPAHCDGALIFDSVLDPGVLGAVPDDALAIPDCCVPV